MTPAFCCAIESSSDNDKYILFVSVSTKQLLPSEVFSFVDLTKGICGESEAISVRLFDYNDVNHTSLFSIFWGVKPLRTLAG